jgi:hypothetical protein
MRRTQFLKQKRKLARKKKNIKYKETANIKNEALHFLYEKLKKPDKKNIEKLKKLFREQGAVNRLNLRNHILATIDRQILVNILKASEIFAENILTDLRNDYSKLDFPIDYRLIYFYKRYEFS